MRDVWHTIPLIPGAQPVSTPVYRLSPRELELARTEVQRLLQAGLIEPSNSPWGAPALFVPKPRSDQLRMVIDYRAIKKLTVRNQWPIPRVDDLLDLIACMARVFTAPWIWQEHTTKCA